MGIAELTCIHFCRILHPFPDHASSSPPWKILQLECQNKRAQFPHLTLQRQVLYFWQRRKFKLARTWRKLNDGTKGPKNCNFISNTTNLPMSCITWFSHLATWAFVCHLSHKAVNSASVMVTNLAFLTCKYVLNVIREWCNNPGHGNFILNGEFHNYFRQR